MTELKQEFKASWFLPPKSYLGDWIKTNEKYFPGSGTRVTINIGGINYESEFWKLESLVNSLQKETNIVSSVDSWMSEFRNYLEGNGILDGVFDSTGMNHTEFYFRLTQFLYSPRGAKYQKNFQFDSLLQCGSLTPGIELTQIEFTHRLFSGSEEHVPAMLRIKDIVASYNFSQKAFAIGNDRHSVKIRFYVKSTKSLIFQPMTMQVGKLTKSSLRKHTETLECQSSAF